MRVKPRRRGQGAAAATSAASGVGFIPRHRPPGQVEQLDGASGAEPAHGCMAVNVATQSTSMRMWPSICARGAVGCTHCQAAFALNLMFNCTPLFIISLQRLLLVVRDLR